MGEDVVVKFPKRLLSHGSVGRAYRSHQWGAEAIDDPAVYSPKAKTSRQPAEPENLPSLLHAAPAGDYCEAGRTKRDKVRILIQPLRNP